MVVFSRILFLSVNCPHPTLLVVSSVKKSHLDLLCYQFEPVIWYVYETEIFCILQLARVYVLDASPSTKFGQGECYIHFGRGL